MISGMASFTVEVYTQGKVAEDYMISMLCGQFFILEAICSAAAG